MSHAQNMISAALLGIKDDSPFYARTVGFIVAQGRALDIGLIDDVEFLLRAKAFYAAVAEQENIQ